MDFRTLLQRADEPDLKLLVGTSLVEVLVGLDPTLALPSNLRELILNQFELAQILRDKIKRQAVFNLLDVAEADNLAREFGNKQGNSYEFLGNLNFPKGSNKELELFTYFSIPQLPNELRENHSSLVEAEVKSALFPHQIKVSHQAFEKLSSSKPRLVVHMPTGSGKTRTAMSIISRDMNKKEACVILWIAYSEELCEQAFQDFLSNWESWGMRKTEAHRFYGSHDIDLDSVSDGIIVASIGKLLSKSRTQVNFLPLLSSKTDLVIFDEAHQAVAPVFRDVLDVIVDSSPDTKLLGLTATPGRTTELQVEEDLLATYFYEQKVTIPSFGFDGPIEYLVSEGFLAKANFKILPYAKESAYSQEELRRLQLALDVSPEFLNRIGADSVRTLLVLDEISKLTLTHKRIIVFSASVEHAKIINAALAVQGLASKFVFGETESHIRRQNLSWFKDETLDCRILVNFGVLTTGFDAPKTSAVVIARPTKSLVLYSQMVGRALRGPRANGNEEATILTILDSDLPGFMDVSKAFENWESNWNQAKGIKNVNTK